MKAKVEIEMNMNMDLSGVLFESEMEVLETLGERSVSLARQQWVGWKYGKYYPPEQMGTSGRSWESRLMQPSETGEMVRGIMVFNDAEIQRRQGTYEPKYWGRKSGKSLSYKNKNVGKHYAAYVTRSTSTEPEWEEVKRRIVVELIPDAITDLRDKIVANAGKNRVTAKFVATKPADTEDRFDINTETLI